MRHQTHKAVFCCLLLFSASALAEKWEFEPRLSVTESYFDNLTLVSDESGEKNGELVTQLLPGFSLTRKSRRLQLNALYTYGYIKYLGNEFSDRSYNQGSLNASAELIRQYLFMNAIASVSQQVFDPTRAFSANTGGNLSTSPVYVTNNQIETRTIGLQPRLVNRFGPYANSTLNYDYSILNYSGSAISNYQRSTLTYNLSSGRWFKNLSWNANATQSSSSQTNAEYLSSYMRVDYDLSRHWALFTMMRAQKYSYLSLANTSPYFINPEAGIVWTASRKLKTEVGGGGALNAGDLSNNKITFDQRTWRVIVNLQPTTRTQFSLGRTASVYGDQKFMNFSHRVRRGDLSSSYSELLITPQQLRSSTALTGGALGGGGFGSTGGFGGGGFGGGFGGSGVADSAGILGRIVTDDVLLRKRLNANISLSYKKLTLTGGGFFDEGEYQTSKVRDKRYGVNSGVDKRIGRSTNWSNQLSVQRYYFENGNRVDNISTFTSTLSRQVNKRINTSLTYQWRNRDSSSGIANYTAQMLIARLDATF